LIALVPLVAITLFAPQPACAASSTSMSIQATMACCRTLQPCPASASGRTCCPRGYRTGAAPSGSALPPAWSESMERPTASAPVTAGHSASVVVAALTAASRVEILSRALTRSRFQHPPLPFYIALSSLLV